MCCVVTGDLLCPNCKFLQQPLTFSDIYSEGSFEKTYGEEDKMSDEEIIALYLKRDENAITATKDNRLTPFFIGMLKKHLNFFE